MVVYRVCGVYSLGFDGFVARKVHDWRQQCIYPSETRTNVIPIFRDTHPCAICILFIAVPLASSVSLIVHEWIRVPSGFRR